MPAGRVERVRQQDQDVDVGMREELAAAVAADGDSAMLGRRAQLAPDRDDDAIDEARVTAQQPRRVGLRAWNGARKRRRGRWLNSSRQRDAGSRRARGRRARRMPSRALAVTSRSAAAAACPAEIGQHLEAVRRHQHRVLPLRGQRMIGGDDRPAVGQARMPGRPALIIGSIVKIIPGCIQAGAGPAVVQHLRLLVELRADAVAAEFAHDGEAVALGESLDRVADVAEWAPGRTARMPRHIASYVTSTRRLAWIEGAPTKNIRLVSPW